MSRDLYSRVFERAVFPVLDRLNGTSIQEKLNLLLAWERLDPDEIRRHQERKLLRAVEFARGNSEFYQQLWKKRGVASAHPLLDGLPVLTKEDLTSAPGSFPIPGYRGKLTRSLTSGSTGSPMTFYRSAEQESWFWALRFRMWSWSGYHPGDPYLTINLNPRLAWKKRLQDRLFRCAYLTYNADNQDSQRLVDELFRRDGWHLNGFSSSLFVLARYMLEHGIDGRSVLGVTATGDALYPEYRETIEECFGVHVLDYYGAGGEGVHLASQCLESGERFHIHPENAVLEILGNDGPAEPGVPGRIVVTQLDNEAMPLIRFELGDMAVAAPQDEFCPCGRTLPLLQRIEGRIPDLIAVLDGTFRVTHFFVVLFKDLQSVHRYQVHQQQRDNICIRLVARDGCQRNEIEATIRRQVADGTRGLLSVDVEWVNEIPLSGAGKRRLVISEISRDSLR